MSEDSSDILQIFSLQTNNCPSNCVETLDKTSDILGMKPLLYALPWAVIAGGLGFPHSCPWEKEQTQKNDAI
jgi:hypothetical protein